jgi:hypothetical protein
MLTDTAIKKAKPGTKPVRMFDGGGLYLELATSGGKLWRFKYRFDGKEKRQALGSYPDTSLAKAREKRDEARRLLADGIDPSEHRKAHKATRAEVAGNTFEAIGREWYSKELPLWAPAQAVKVKGIFEKNLYPWLGSPPNYGNQGGRVLGYASPDGEAEARWKRHGGRSNTAGRYSAMQSLPGGPSATLRRT